MTQNMNLTPRTMRTTLLAAVLLLIMGTPSQAQNNTVADKPRIGVFGDVSYDIFGASFSRLPEVPNCCPEFTGGSGIGFFGGIVYIAPIDPTWLLDLRMHYGTYSVDMTATQTLPTVLGDGTTTNAEIQHDLSGSFTQISVEPMVGYRLTPDLSLRAGIMAGYRVTATYDQSETLVQPANATFETGRRTRNAVSGDIEGVNAFALGLTIGASYDLPLNSSRTMFLSPEVLFTLSPFDIVKDVSWKVQHLRAGLALTFIPPDVEDSLDEYQLYDVARRTPLPVKGAPGVAFVSNISATGITEDGRTSSTQGLKIEEFASTRVRPILPYVFFDNNSAALPSRYRRINQDQVDSYSLDNFYNLDAMVTYRQMLNIIGKRMTDNESATLTLTGCMDNAEDKAAGDLSGQRAAAVKSYLVDTWGIKADRISVESRGLPATPSNVNEADGREENRRVEIASSDASILAPVMSNDTMRVFEPAGVRFMPSIDPRVPISSWTVFVSEDERIIRTFHAGEPIPASVDWRISEQSGVIPRGTRNIEYMLVVQDSTGDVVPSEMKVIPVSEVTLEDKKRSGGVDKSIDRYSLILFAFDKADLSNENQAIVNSVKGRIDPNAQVKIVGYTDRSGADDYNQRLSEQRARSVASALGLTNATVTGLGERLPLYDNTTPEGRFYSRTVEIVVETPRR
ncbi:MAG: OmpA family protein [Ignavibacteria bacterium]|nr:OmpA family protein [Ignavibacteria bacterium]MBP6509519.1 OmpA family protein [Candidatus Kapabacteria bacterium]MBK7411408.1 OmpA family protein [Ignavibacteria bacterium]MBK7577836.1 OmpA family protein [Ignavibacteria bacterium]MBK9184342.1 OmpA family protein [Ignavibacteria bacterium]